MTVAMIDSRILKTILGQITNFTLTFPVEYVLLIRQLYESTEKIFVRFFTFIVESERFFRTPCACTNRSHAQSSSGNHRVSAIHMLNVPS